jgi:SAM-dependent methyltransferase
MEKSDEAIIKSYFSNLYRQHGFKSESTGYSPRGQEIRYQVLSHLSDLRGKKILEVGSGLGHFYQFLKRQDPTVRYTGFEINPDFLRETTQRFGPIFQNRNLMVDPVHQEFDVAFSVGILNNTRLKDNLASTRELMRAMFDACTDFCALSMTSVFVDPAYKQDYMVYFDPTEIFMMARSFTKYVSVLHDYLPHDFTVVLRKHEHYPLSASK